MDPWSVWIEDLQIQVKTYLTDPDRPSIVKSVDHALTLDQARELRKALDEAIKEAETFSAES
jgi:hypothetical protein